MHRKIDETSETDVCFSEGKKKVVETIKNETKARLNWFDILRRRK